MNSDDPHDLQRFIDAQSRTYATALTEIRDGRKRSHWMWYVFPQFAGLGFSATSRHYAINSLEEARAYLAHPILGPRLLECCEALLSLDRSDPQEIFGSPDDLKLGSSMTLFAHVSGADSISQHVLDKYFAGQRDERTIELVAASQR
jgi:uncharacterized protein (DUF1810 family)